MGDGTIASSSVDYSKSFLHKTQEREDLLSQQSAISIEGHHLFDDAKKHVLESPSYEKIVTQGTSKPVEYDHSLPLDSEEQPEESQLLPFSSSKVMEFSDPSPPLTVDMYRTTPNSTQKEEPLPKKVSIADMWSIVVNGLFDMMAQSSRNDLAEMRCLKAQMHIMDQHMQDCAQKLRENHERERSCSQTQKVIQIFLISCGLVGGISLCASTICTGNLYAFWQGLKMVIGSSLSILAFSLEQLGYNRTCVTGCTILSAVMNCWGVHNSLALWENNTLIKCFAESQNYVVQVIKMIIGHVQLNVQQEKESLAAQHSNLEMKKRKNQDRTKNFLTTALSTGWDNLFEVHKTAAKHIDRDSEMKTRILNETRL